MHQGKRKFSAVEAPRVNIKHPKRIQATPFSKLVKQGTGKFHHYTLAHPMLKGKVPEHPIDFSSHGGFFLL